MKNSVTIIIDMYNTLLKPVVVIFIWKSM